MNLIVVDMKLMGAVCFPNHLTLVHHTLPPLSLPCSMNSWEIIERKNHRRYPRHAGSRYPCKLELTDKKASVILHTVSYLTADVGDDSIITRSVVAKTIVDEFVITTTTIVIMTNNLHSLVVSLF